MRVMIDTNILISAVYNPESVPAKAVRLTCERYKLVLCDHIINECYDVVQRNFPKHMPAMDKFLNTLVFETVISPRIPGSLISDPKDSPILNAAIINEVDIIISGDGHFTNLEIERPKVLKATDFLANYTDMD